MKKQKLVNRIYYRLKPLIPRRAQIWLRSYIALRKRSKYIDVWPILERSGAPPHDWPGWPEQKQFALVLTHDVDTAKGQERCYDLMELEKELGFRSSFNFVPERYRVSTKLRHDLTSNGFEVGVHGLYHDGKLYESRKIFETRAAKINHYLKEWGSVGFRSPAMQHILDWIHSLEIEYDASTFDTDPFGPQPEGAGVIFPFRVKGSAGQRAYVELPYTLPQDFILFILLKETSIDIWKKKLDWISQQGGMALVNTHPDYMNFDGGNPAREEYPAQYYKEFLQYIKTQHRGKYWHALPKEAASFVNSIKSI